MELTLTIPDDLAKRFGTQGELERKVLEALVLGADSAREDHTLAEPVLDDATRARAREAADRIIARRKGVTLGGLAIKDLINEGRP